MLNMKCVSKFNGSCCNADMLRGRFINTQNHNKYIVNSGWWCSGFTKKNKFDSGATCRGSSNVHKIHAGFFYKLIENDNIFSCQRPTTFSGVGG